MPRKARALGFLDEIVEGDLRSGSRCVCACVCLRPASGPRRTRRNDVSIRAPRRQRFSSACERRARELYPNRNAGLVAVDAVRAAPHAAVPAGLEYETQRVNECKQSVESKGAVHAFFAERETRRIPGLSDGRRPRPVKSRGRGRRGHDGRRHRDLLCQCRDSGDAARRESRSSGAGLANIDGHISRWWIAAA